MSLLLARSGGVGSFQTLPLLKVDRTCVRGADLVIRVSGFME
jgi:hypothetical protein